MMTTRIIESTIATVFNQTSNTVCSGWFDIDGTWNNGFPCRIENFIQYFCCGTDTYRYCCSPDRYLFETKFDTDVKYSPIYHNILTSEISLALLNNRKLINKQFEQFQRYFFPVFLLSSTVLFLIGIALWFWLYKHKAFYSLDQDDLIELRTIQQNSRHSISTIKDTDNHTIQQKSQSLLYPITEV
ncbi:unnamed protein product [Adineta steineri]|uniref:Shisa N-terminal domain-containing protein n=2 Tax=Adineta steineri TaxID=433720 RepID=A0A819KQT7_9BILA|nr:unnamed protein product [Adineta steineri]CAF3949258.1 unnamed protein product [Adineta steineri]